MLGPRWKKGILWRAGWLAAVAAGCVGAAGCGSGDQNAQTTGGPAKSHKTTAADKGGGPSMNDMVAAVSPSKGPPIELRFSLPVRPEVGQATEIDVALIPTQPLPDSVAISFQVVDGLDIVDGSQMERIDKLTAGTPIRHVLKVLPKRDGVFAITAVVSYTASNQELNRTFSIPVIAGAGLTDQVAKGP